VDPGFRVTDATLDVLEILLDGGDDLYGLKIAKATGRPTGSVFPILARLEGCGWVTSEWETSDPSARGPRRRFYRLSPDGAELAVDLLRQRRAKTSRPRLRPVPAPRPQLQGGQ
jgi:PadR family transcriptional regulator, regulatory protein PadR